MRAGGAAAGAEHSGHAAIIDGARAQYSGLAAALALAEEYGLPVFPCRPDKRPYTPHGFRDASRNIEQIAQWWTDWPDALIGVPTGRASGLLVVDIDPAGAEWYREHADRLGAGRIHRTRRDGWHLLYRMPADEVRCSASRIARGVDVRAEGGYIIWWPTHGCRAVGALEELTEPPTWLLALLRESGRETRAAESADGMIGPGGRNDYLSREAYRLRRQGASVEQILEALRALNRVRCSPQLDDDEVRQIAAGKARVQPAIEDGAASATDFYAYLPQHAYIYVPTRELWPAASVNARIDMPKATEWLDRNRAVEQMTWAPGEPMVIHDRLISGGGWIERAGVRTFNLYLPPNIEHGDASRAVPWIEHVQRVYGEHAEHIIRWLAHRVQRPGEKINHALVLGGTQGIGKDTLLEPVKHAVGAWNWAEVSPCHLLGRFNGFVKSVVLRISEARDLGDVDRFAFYDHLKVYTAAPPDVLRCDEKNIREHSVLNVCGVIITSNHKTDGIYLPADDRRHFVAWSDRQPGDFLPGYWPTLYRWYAEGGIQHVAAYLATLDITSFDPKAPPLKTAAWHDIVDANRAPEDAELADVLDKLGNPDAVTLGAIISRASDSFAEWLQERRNRRQIPHRLENAGYVPVRNDAASDGLWRLNRRRQAIYARASLSQRDRLAAASALAREAF